MELKKKNTIAIIQARVSSKRFPNKVLQKIGKKKIIDIIVERLKKSKKIHKIVIAIPKNKENLQLKNYLVKKKYNIFLGKENDVLSRYYFAAKKFKAKIIVRITSDCPLVDYKIIDKMLKKTNDSNLEIFSNVYKNSFPDGLDVEIFNFQTLKKTFKLAKNLYDKEHVTKFMYNSNLIKVNNFNNQINYSRYKFSVDDKEDLDNLNDICKIIGFKNFHWRKILKYLIKNSLYSKKFISKNRNEGSYLKTGQKIWKRALKIIPGGNMLKSKSPDMFLPNVWPTYFSKTSGCTVWDLDNKKYYDLSLMAVGTNVLGYSNKSVDTAVHSAIHKGNMSTLNCKEEVELAEKLIEIHPWAQMAKFCRTGGEANAVAIRIARAATGKERILVCGYHGWHDWY